MPDVIEFRHRRGPAEFILAHQPGLDTQPTAEVAPAGRADNPEVATKLELAAAYEEMGDKDGARELFQEALAEGSPAQQKAARAKLDSLA